MMPFKLKPIQLLLVLAAVLAAPSSAVADIGDSAQAQQFIDEMVSRDGFDRRQLQDIFSGLRTNDKVIALISRPAEKKPWHEYRPIFITRARVNGGVEFLRDWQQVLHRAEQQYGVPAEIITAILGVETRYGDNTGSFKVLHTLTTLAFAYPPRAEFFRGELRHLLLLGREQGMDITELKGSYAGAMGIPQFISSSYRNYAVDFDNDGKVDIWNNYSDAIGSVANYLRENGWIQEQADIALAVDIEPAQYQQLVNGSTGNKVSAAALAEHGIILPASLEVARVLSLDNADSAEYWLALPNFECITTYNRSDLYAMAVLQLSQGIAP